MLQNISSLEGVTVLSKQQQKNLSGGNYQAPANSGFTLTPSGSGGVDTRCRVLLGNGSGGVINFTGATSGQAVSDAANAWCVNAVINNGAGSCRYDCYHDGQG